MTVGSMTAAPAEESGGGAPRDHAPAKACKATEARPRTVTKIVDRTSREMALHVTTTLSRSWDDLSRVFGRMRDAIAYERFMHASFGWALSPMQRLMPSAAWPLAYASLNSFGAPTRGVGPIAGADMFGIGLAWWRGFTQPTPSWQQSRGWQPRLPAPQTRKSDHAGGRSNDFAAFAFAPMLGFAAGLEQMMPAMGFGLFA
jgi:hypothetical protein